MNLDKHCCVLGKMTEHVRDRYRQYLTQDEETDLRLRFVCLLKEGDIDVDYSFSKSDCKLV